MAYRAAAVCVLADSIADIVSGDGDHHRTVINALSDLINSCGAQSAYGGNGQNYGGDTGSGKGVGVSDKGTLPCRVVNHVYIPP